MFRLTDAVTKSSGKRNVAERVFVRRILVVPSVWIEFVRIGKVLGVAMQRNGHHQHICSFRNAVTAYSKSTLRIFRCSASWNELHVSIRNIRAAVNKYDEIHIP